jgi:hypothetical protein
MSAALLAAKVDRLRGFTHHNLTNDDLDTLIAALESVDRPTRERDEARAIVREHRTLLSALLPLAADVRAALDHLDTLGWAYEAEK